MLHWSFKFIGARANDCVQFADNHWNFQVIQLDSCSNQNIEMSEEKIICLIATLDPSQHFPDDLKWDSKPLLNFLAYSIQTLKAPGTNSKSCYKLKGLTSE